MSSSASAVICQVADPSPSQDAASQCPTKGRKRIAVAGIHPERRPRTFRLASGFGVVITTSLIRVRDLVLISAIVQVAISLSR